MLLGKQSLKLGDFQAYFQAAELSDEKLHPVYSRSPFGTLQNSFLSVLKTGTRRFECHAVCNVKFSKVSNVYNKFSDGRVHICRHLLLFFF